MCDEFYRLLTDSIFLEHEVIRHGEYLAKYTLNVLMAYR